MKKEETVYIKLYSNHKFKGKLILKYGDAVQIEFWWVHQQKGNYVEYEKINNH